jgi:hypothetical protein
VRVGRYAPRMSSAADLSATVGAHSWGQLEIEGFGEFGDAKLWPGGGREWDWTETNTHHVPGIQPAELRELLDHRPEVVVLSGGRELRLQTTAEALALLDEHNIEVVWDETSAAIEEYNRLAREGVRVAALLHSTC